MFYAALSDEAAKAAADAVRAWSELLLAWSALARTTSPQESWERWTAVVEAGARAQQASLRAAMLGGAGARLASSPFGVTGLFASMPPASASQPGPSAAMAPTHRGFQSLAKPLGRADDLTRIKGLGPKMQAKLNALGVFHFWQLASLSKADAERLDGALGANGRIARDNWIAQAKKLAEDVPA
jgi:predicted flap endonuclease-1-like 5' DNA nuclease